MSDFTGNKIKDTFQRVLQVDGGNIQNGTGNPVDATINSLTASNGFQGNIDGTASYSDQALTASYIQNAQTASYVELAQTASYVNLAQTASYVLNAVSASYAPPSVSVSASYATTASYVTLAQTASYVNPLRQNVIITGSLTVSGSSTFTNIGPANFTGSLGVTGSTNLIGSLNISGSTTNKVELFLPLTSSQNISSSLDVITRTGSFDYIIDRGNAVINGNLVVNGALTLAGGLQFGPTFASASLIANTNNLLISNLANSILVRLLSTGNYSLTGITVPDNTKTYFFNIFNVGTTGNIIFKNDDAGSTAQNRFLLGGDITVQPGEGLTFIYDPVDLRWRSPGKNI